MKIYKQERKKRKKTRDCCSDVPSCDCGDIPGCEPCLIFPTLLGLIAIQRPARQPRERTSAAGLAGVAAIRGYQRWLSPRLRTNCPHRPSCSGYGITAVRRYGLIAGTRLTAGRIRRCTGAVPRGTVDPVP